VLPKETGRLEQEQEVVLSCQSLLQMLQEPTPRNDESTFRALVAMGTLAHHLPHARTFLKNATLPSVEGGDERIAQASHFLQQLVQQ